MTQLKRAWIALPYDTIEEHKNSDLSWLNKELWIFEYSCKVLYLDETLKVISYFIVGVIFEAEIQGSFLKIFFRKDRLLASSVKS